jgi:cytochrome P450
MISSGTNILLERPALWQALQERPDLIPNFVEEVLRCEAPVQMTARIATVDVDLGEHAKGYAVPQGGAVTVIFGGANRDAGVFDDPSQFDPRRDNANKHIAFATGAHYCLGAALARLEGKSAFTALTQRLPEIRRAGPIRRSPATVSRAMESLPIAVSPAVLARQT